MNITDDAVREDAETFTVTLEKPVNGSLQKILIHPAMVTVTILDNDGKDMHTIIVRILHTVQFNIRNSILGIYHESNVGKLLASSQGPTDSRFLGGAWGRG